MNIITIRPALSTDAKSISEIYAPYVVHTAITFEYSAPCADEIARRIQAVTDQSYPYLVACDNQHNIVGFAYAKEFATRPAYRFCSELSIYVHPGMQTAGIGQLLYNAIEERLIEYGIVNLVSIITIPNEASIRFHEKNNFEKIGYFRNAGYKFNKWHDIIWMKKELKSPFK